MTEQKKLTNIEKIKEKYTFAGSMNQKIDPEIIKNIKLKINLNQKSPKFDASALFPPTIRESPKENEHIFTHFTKKQSPRKKFDIFYNELMDYYRYEMKDKDLWQKDISHQARIFDEELRKINLQLFDFNANLDKDFKNEGEEDETRLKKFFSHRHLKSNR